MKKAFACIAILAVVCGAVWHFCNPFEIIMLRDGIARFERTASDRSEDRVHTKTIGTSKGSFSIATGEMTRNADGTLNTHAPGRNEGYFVAPPMRWVKDLTEAQKVVSVHYVLHGGDPMVTPSSGPTTAFFPNPE